MIEKTLTFSASTSYDILIGRDILADVGELFRRYNIGGKIYLITDNIVDELYSDIVISSITDVGYSVEVQILSAGEATKSMDALARILEHMAECEITRSDTVVAFGGGVIGDIAGFAAAIYQRGIEYVNIPTTFLAQIDSSVGGKTAVNLSHGKNLVGAFKQPKLVVIDTEVQQTLTDERFKDGLVEAIKYGMIGNERLFDTLVTTRRSGLINKMTDIVNDCLMIKCDLVAEDEYDKGSRQLLNFGHTIGHAIEQISNFSVTHGYAVAVGMQMITAVSDCSDDVKKRIKEALIFHDLPIVTDYSADRLFAAIRSDKKRSDDRITVVVPEEVGKCELKQLSLPECKVMIEQAAV